MSSPTIVRPVPTGWRVLFGVLDLAFPIGGIFGHLFAPQAILSGFTATPRNPANVETQVLLDGMAGWYAALASLHLYLQFSAPRDRKLWCVVIASVILVDLFMLLGFIRGLNAEARLFDTRKWRNEDWSNIGGYSVITLLRIIFVMRSNAKPVLSHRVDGINRKTN